MEKKNNPDTYFSYPGCFSVWPSEDVVSVMGTASDSAFFLSFYIFNTFILPQTYFVFGHTGRFPLESFV